MGAGSAGTSNDSGGKDTKTPFGKASSTKTKTKFGYTKPKSKFKTFIEGGGVIGAVTKPFRDATEEVNRKFYNEKVVPAGKSKAPNYETYMKDRLAGKTDAYGNPTSNEGGGGNGNGSNKNQNGPPPVTIMPIPTDAPNKSLDPVTSEEDKKYDERKTKKKGRSKNILTSKQGVMKTSADYSLGKKSLLGQVV